MHNDYLVPGCFILRSLLWIVIVKTSISLKRITLNLMHQAACESTCDKQSVREVNRMDLDENNTGTIKTKQFCNDLHTMGPDTRKRSTTKRKNKRKQISKKEPPLPCNSDNNSSSDDDTAYVTSVIRKPRVDPHRVQEIMALCRDDVAQQACKVNSSSKIYTDDVCHDLNSVEAEDLHLLTEMEESVFQPETTQNKVKTQVVKSTHSQLRASESVTDCILKSKSESESENDDCDFKTGSSDKDIFSQTGDEMSESEIGSCCAKKAQHPLKLFKTPGLIQVKYAKAIPYLRDYCSVFRYNGENLCSSYKAYILDSIQAVVRCKKVPLEAAFVGLVALDTSLIIGSKFYKARAELLCQFATLCPTLQYSDLIQSAVAYSRVYVDAKDNQQYLEKAIYYLQGLEPCEMFSVIYAEYAIFYDAFLLRLAVDAKLKKGNQETACHFFLKASDLADDKDRMFHLKCIALTLLNINRWLVTDSTEELLMTDFDIDETEFHQVQCILDLIAKCGSRSPEENDDATNIELMLEIRKAQTKLHHKDYSSALDDIEKAEEVVKRISEHENCSEIKDKTLLRSVEIYSTYLAQIREEALKGIAELTKNKCYSIAEFQTLIAKLQLQDISSSLSSTNQSSQHSVLDDLSDPNKPYIHCGEDSDRN